MGMGLIYVILAAGLVLILSVSRIFLIAYGQFYMIGAYVVWAGSTFLKLPFPVSLCMSVLTTAMLALICYRLIFHYIQYLERQFLAMIVAAIGLMMVLGQTGLVLFGTSPRGVGTIFPGLVHFIGINVSVEKLVLMVLAITITLTLFFVYEKTKIDHFINYYCGNAWGHGQPVRGRARRADHGPDHELRPIFHCRPGPYTSFFPCWHSFIV